jgi:hypothetical protein
MARGWTTTSMPKLVHGAADDKNVTKIVRKQRRFLLAGVLT